MPAEVPPWVRDAVFYQIFPDRFARSVRVHRPGPLEPWQAPPTRHGFKGGDLLGIAERLDHLSELGVTAISLNPVFASASPHRYHTYDYRAVDPLLGGEAALRELLDAAHARGMRVILDGVFNHASRGFWPFNHVMENGRDSPYRDWFYLDAERLAAGRQLAAFPERSPEAEVDAEWVANHMPGVDSLRTLGYRAWWDLPALPKLNTDNPEVREFLYETAEHWIRFGADGWRLDVAEEIETPGFWEEFRRRVKAVNPEAYLLAEVWDERPDLLGGHRYDALMNYPFLYAVVGFASGHRLDRRVVRQHGSLERHVQPLDGVGFATRLEHLARAYEPAVVEAMLNLVDGHDTPRLRSMAGDDVAAVRIATLVQMTFPGAPCIYYGDEIGLRGEGDPECRGGFPWSPEDWDRELLAFTRAAVRLRRATPVLREGAFRIVGAEGSALAYLRSWARDSAPGRGPAAVLVGLNNGEQATTLTVRLPELAGARFVADEALHASLGVTGSAPTSVLLDDRGRVNVTVPARSGIVLATERAMGR